MPEAKVLEKIRRVLIDDATLAASFADRVYASHISLVADPLLPAISLHLLTGGAAFQMPVTEVSVQIDIWMPVDRFTVDKVLAAASRIRALLHRQNLTDTTIGVTIGQIIERSCGPILYDSETDSHHYPIRYEVTAL
jgi:hypothetical protein